jgi:CRP-like cAMP-binding protein
MGRPTATVAGAPGEDMVQQARRVPCEQCPLRAMPHFRPFTADELRFVSKFKRGEMVAEARSTILSEGSHSAQLFTLLSGWAFRYKMLDDGRRQILNYVLPGDLVGLQGSVAGAMDHSVEALSAAVLCVFQRSDITTLYQQQPGLAFDITWLAAREERMLDDNLLSLGRRTAIERAAYLIALLYQRAAAVGIGRGKRLLIPISQQHVADTLGLSIVHTNKTLRKLSERNLIRWYDRACEVLDEKGLLELSGWAGLPESRRPFI